MFTKRLISFERFISLATFSVNELGIYDQEDLFSIGYDQLDLFSETYEANTQQLKQWFSKLFMSDEYISYFDLDKTNVSFSQIISRKKLVESTIDGLVKILLYENNMGKITIYPIIKDTGNEINIQWALVGSKHLILINKFYYL